MDASVSTPLARGRGAIATKISEGSLFTRLACTKRASNAPLGESARGRGRFLQSGRGLWLLEMFWAVLEAVNRPSCCWWKGEDVFSRIAPGERLDVLIKRLSPFGPSACAGPTLVSPPKKADSGPPLIAQRNKESPAPQAGLANDVNGSGAFQRCKCRCGSISRGFASRHSRPARSAQCLCQCMYEYLSI